VRRQNQIQTNSQQDGPDDFVNKTLSAKIFSPLARRPARQPRRHFTKNYSDETNNGQILLSFVLIFVPGFVLQLTNHAFGWVNIISDAEAGGLEKTASFVGVKVADFQYLPNFWNRLVGRYGDIPGGNRK
jgi:hypothetical protein